MLLHYYYSNNIDRAPEHDTTTVTHLLYEYCLYTGSNTTSTGTATYDLDPPPPLHSQVIVVAYARQPAVGVPANSRHMIECLNFSTLRLTHRATSSPLPAVPLGTATPQSSVGLQPHRRRTWREKGERAINPGVLKGLNTKIVTCVCCCISHMANKS